MDFFRAIRLPPTGNRELGLLSLFVSKNMFPQLQSRTLVLLQWDVLYTDLVDWCNAPHTSTTWGGSVGHGPSQQVSFFPFFSFLLFYLFCLYFRF
jgi:hypothetical protein